MKTWDGSAGVAAARGREVRELALPDKLRERDTVVIGRVAGTIRRLHVGVVKKAKLTRLQHAVLCCLDEHGPCRPSEVAEALGVDRGNLVSVVRPLIQKVLVWRKIDDDDLRCQTLSLSKSGADVLASLEAGFDRADARLFEILNDGERAALRGLAARLMVFGGSVSGGR
jgi:DNA-binding MarR family transcriptional regulator